MKPAPLELLAANLAESCTDCEACVAGCAFLQEQGSPGRIARAFLNATERDPSSTRAFHCSICGLCSSLCPKKLQPADMFRAMRGYALQQNLVSMRPYRGLLNYEALGQSALLADRIIPPGCDTVLFPGCNFPGSRPQTLLKLTRHLQTLIPNLGVVFDCCSKPSHDLGRTAVFEAKYSALCQNLLAKGIRRVLTVCPNCQNIFERYGESLQTLSATALLTTADLPKAPKIHAQGVQHIPCPLRGKTAEIAAIRHLAEARGMRLDPLKHQGRRSPCCGEGGGVGQVRPDLAQAWTKRCSTRAGGHPLLTACAGCVSMLQPHMPAMHILDLVFFPQRTVAGHKADSGIKTYLNRILLRWKVRRILSPS